MPADYIITGALSPLGRHIIEKLKARDCRILGIDFPDASGAPAVDFPLRIADVRDRTALGDIFRAEAREYTVVIHAAERMSLSDTPDRELFAVNYGGTKNILDLCTRMAVRRLVYVGSALALAPRPDGGLCHESEAFDPAAVKTPYAKSKAAACAAVMESAGEALDCVIVLPSVLFGGNGDALALDRLLCGLKCGQVRFGVNGCTDVADVRDAAQGVVLAADKGICGRSYILSGRCVTMREFFRTAETVFAKPRRLMLPLAAARLLVKLGREWDGERPLFTETALSLLRGAVHYSHDRATRELGYMPHSLHDALTQAAQRVQAAAADTPALPALPEAAAKAAV